MLLKLLHNQILDFDIPSMRPDINELTADNKYVYATILHEKSFGLYAYDKNTGDERWRYVDDLPDFYLMADLTSVYYQEKIFFAFNDKIIYLNRNSQWINKIPEQWLIYYQSFLFSHNFHHYQIFF